MYRQSKNEGLQKSKIWISDTFNASLVKISKLVLNVAFSLKPFDLGPCVFPGYFSFAVLNFPWIGYDNIAFSNPHLLMFGAWNSAHADNSIHTLKCYPFRA